MIKCFLIENVKHSFFFDWLQSLQRPNFVPSLKLLQVYKCWLILNVADTKIWQQMQRLWKTFKTTFLFHRGWHKIYELNLFFFRSKLSIYFFHSRVFIWFSIFSPILFFVFWKTLTNKSSVHLKKLVIQINTEYKT